MGLAGGCTGSGQVSYSGEVQTPELIEINPGVQVVADYDEPIFYSENYYWRNQGGVWYRSQYHTRGWARFDAAPAAVVHIQTPQAYVHFHGHAGGGAEVRDHREMAPPPPSPEVRDHRDMAPPPPPSPEVRDHREMKEEHKDMKEERKDMKEERKDMKEERKEERKDAKDHRKEEKEERKHGH